MFQAFHELCAYIIGVIHWLILLRALTANMRDVTKWWIVVPQIIPYLEQNTRVLWNGVNNQSVWFLIGSVRLPC